MTEEVKNKRGFQKGNTYGKGRPTGSKTTRAILLKDYATEEDHICITRQLIELAKGGDFAAISLYINKVAQTPKLPSTVDLGFAKEIHTITDMNDVMTDLAYGAMSGTVHMDDAKELMDIAQSKGNSIDRCLGEQLDLIRDQIAELQSKK
jgi:hypothetical protein